MDGDFGAQLDAALNGHLAALHASAQEARDRIERDANELGATVAPAFTEPIGLREVSPVTFDAQPIRSGAAVSFDLDEPSGNGTLDDLVFDAVPVDAEGIPLPEDNP